MSAPEDAPFLGGLSALVELKDFREIFLTSAKLLASEHGMVCTERPGLAFSHEIWKAKIFDDGGTKDFSLKAYLKALDYLVLNLSYQDTIDFRAGPNPSIKPASRYVKDNYRIYAALLFGSTLLRLEFERLKADRSILNDCGIGHAVLVAATEKIKLQPSKARQFRTLLGITKKTRRFVEQHRH